MRFGIREVCNVVFRAKTKQTLGSRTFMKGEPVLYFDTLKTSSLEGAATTVYATGGQGNPQLIGWDGERTLTFTMEDALLSMEGLSILTGAGLIAANEANQGHGIFKHENKNFEVSAPNTIVIEGDFVCWTGGATGEVREDESIDDYQHNSADIFVMTFDEDGNINAEPCVPKAVKYSVKVVKKNGSDVLIPVTTITCYGHDGYIPEESVVLVDYYIKRTSKATQVEITADKFSGSYYIEADTLFRRQGDNYDMPAAFVIPNGKIQSNFNFAMANSGDPSTFTFTVDAMPDYTKFDRTHKVLAMIQIIEDEDEEDLSVREVCRPKPVITTAVGASIEIVSDEDDKAEVNITGNRVLENASRNPLFNTNNELTPEDGDPINAMVAEIILDEGKQIVRQTNPALELYEKDAFVHESGSSYIKVKEYNITEPSSYSFIVTENTPKITVEIIKGGILNTATGTVTGGEIAKTYTINSNVTIV